ncbi:ribosome biogenesis GTPase YqeH [Tumebacillus flagellatus]|uniref:GTPase n=1 Tax=Tumebacillus flagellatus TaxID=1157490 RepID=A0A074LYR9_9BACL|nr:ribosome biogenesis GTPase YqeH [Tumebacillus flagellatus]KEO85168.1 GTPase [Tumebacillus flagellatus]
MSELDLDLTCSGCGIVIQTEEKSEPGYAPLNSVIEREFPVCQRCYRIKHYNEVAPVPLNNAGFQKILSDIGRRNALVVKVVDLFDFAGSWVKDIKKYVGKNPILLVANKADLLPRSTNWERVENWLKYEVKKQGVEVDQIFLVSAKKRIEIENVKTAIEARAGKRDVYVVGTANVGKSTLINGLLNLFGEEEGAELTTSRYPGTTLSTISIELPGHGRIIDTPGIMTKHRLTDLVSPKGLRDITPEAYINPKTYQLNDGQTLFLGGLARVDYVEGPKQGFTVYCANQLNVHRTKLENADELYAKHLGTLLTPPYEGEEINPVLTEWVTHSFTLKSGHPQDVVISGIGWVTLRGQHYTNVRIHAPKGVDVHTRRALI